MAQDIIFSGLAERQTFAPYSLLGGTTPQRGRTILHPGAHQCQWYGKGVYTLACGDTLRFELPEAGAYSVPLERDPLSCRQRDVRNDYISRQTAERVYGHVLTRTRSQWTR